MEEKVYVKNLGEVVIIGRIDISRLSRNGEGTLKIQPNKNNLTNLFTNETFSFSIGD